MISQIQFNNDTCNWMMFCIKGNMLLTIYYTKGLQFVKCILIAQSNGMKIYYIIDKSYFGEHLLRYFGNKLQLIVIRKIHRSTTILTVDPPLLNHQLYITSNWLLNPFSHSLTYLFKNPRHPKFVSNFNSFSFRLIHLILLMASSIWERIPSHWDPIIPSNF